MTHFLFISSTKYAQVSVHFLIKFNFVITLEFTNEQHYNRDNNTIRVKYYSNKDKERVLAERELACHCRNPHMLPRIGIPRNNNASVITLF